MRTIFWTTVCAAASALMAVFVAPAGAAVGCSYTAANHTVTVNATANNDSVTFVRSGAAIEVNGAACGAATVNNTDTIRVNPAAGRQYANIDLHGGPFAPGFTAEGAPAEIEFNVDLGAGTDRLTVQGSNSGDHVTAGTSGLNLNQDSDLDVAMPGVEELSVYGNGAADAISAAGGAGTGLAYTRRVTFDGGAGTDAVTGGDAPDYLYGGDNADTIYGGDSRDYVYGGLGGDSLHGGNSNDYLYGNTEADSLFGDAGNDTFYADAVADGSDTVNGGDGRDTISYYGRTVKVTVTLNNNADDGQSGEGDNVKTDVENITGGQANDTLTGDPDSNSLDGLTGADTANGLGGDDSLYGGYSDTGADTLNGGEGNDSLYGYGGADHLNGEGGEDYFVDGPGSDAVNGGPGDDTMYPESAADGADTYSGGPGEDYISFYYRTAALTITLDSNANDGQAGEQDNVKGDVEDIDGGQGPDHITGSSSDNSIYGEGSADVLSGAQGVDYLTGGDGGDTLNGGDGEDSMYGYAGNDIFQAQDGGYDYLDGGSESDTVANQDVGIDQLSNIP